MLSEAKVLEYLSEVKDPEVPVLSVVELGIIRKVSCGEASVEITVTPTYSGCPAITLINEAIVACLKSHGVQNVSLTTTFSPPWTTDWIPESAKAKLKAYGIAPPGPATEEPLVPFPHRPQEIACPFCNSLHTTVSSEFGSTACKSYYFCKGCQQPFERFKPI